LRKLYLYILFTIFILPLSGQDFHYSMYRFSPLTMNPALTGVFDFDHKNDDLRVAAHYRQQWRSIPSAYLSSPTPFTTTSFAIDHKIRITRLLRRDFIGAGALFYNDKTGDLNFGTQQTGLSLSYNKSLSRSMYEYLSFGIQNGFVNRSIAYNNAFFDNQWSGKEFDPTLPNGENFPKDRIYYNDLGLGIMYQHYPDKRANYAVGASLYHLNNPNQSFFGNNTYNISLFRKLVVHGEARYELNYKWYMLPAILYLRQGKVNEVNLGSYFQYHKGKNTSFKIGATYRIVGNYRRSITGDALILAYIFNYGKFDFGFSYDTNTSSLTRASRYRGAFEIVLIYHERVRRLKSKYERFKEYVPDCPDHHYE
jgi:type IX secretion system PorP/SprF family membrane protein